MLKQRKIKDSFDQQNGRSSWLKWIFPYFNMGSDLKLLHTRGDRLLKTYACTGLNIVKKNEGKEEWEFYTSRTL